MKSGSAPAVGRLRVLELGCGFRKTPGASGDDVIPGSQADRAALLAALQSVGLVTIFDEEVPLPVLEIVRPDVYVKSGDYDIENVPEARLIRTWGGAVHAIPFAQDRSTSRLLTRIREVRS